MPAGRPKGSKDSVQRTRFAPKHPNKVRFNYFYASEFVAQLIEEARKQGFGLSEIIESAILAQVTTQRRSDTEYSHRLKLLKKIDIEVVNDKAKAEKIKWQSWTRDLSKSKQYANN